MIALLRARHERGRDASSKGPLQPVPVIREPLELPSPQSRRQKEQAWFSSIRSKTKLGHSGHQHSCEPTCQGKTSPLVRGKSSGSALATSNPAEVHKDIHKSSASVRSTSSKRSFLGLKRQKSSNSIRKLNSDDTLSASYAFVPKEEAPPVPSKDLHTLPSTFQVKSNGSRSLPARLQELSVAHTDGLLDDEEYRMLRTALLEKYAAQGHEDLQSSSLQLGSLGLQPAQPLSVPVEQRTHTTQQSPHDTAALQRPTLESSASSIRSARSTKSRKRRSSRLFNTFANRKTLSLKEDWESLNQDHRRSLALDSDMEETLSVHHPMSHGQKQLDPECSELPVRDARQSRFPPLTTHSRASLVLNIPSEGYTSKPIGSSAGSIRSASMRRDLSSGASVISSSSAGHQSLKGKTLSSAGSVHSHGFETDDDPYAEATPQQLRHEIAQLQAERTRVTDQFEQLIAQARHRIVSSSSSKTVTPSTPSSTSSSLAPALTKSQKRLSTTSSIFRISNYAHRGSGSNNTGSASASCRTTISQPILAEPAEDHKPAVKEALLLVRKRDRVQERYDAQLELLKVRLQGAELRQSLRQ